MTSPAPTMGGCLCGSVRWATDAAVRDVLECHCHRCRRVTGDHIAASAAPTERLRIDAPTGSLRWYTPADDRNVAYGFCANCGSTLFWRSGLVDDSAEVTSITIGSFDRDPGLRTTEIWFCEEARAHVRLPPPAGGIGLRPRGA